jgi:hypothetical protein
VEASGGRNKEGVSGQIHNHGARAPSPAASTLRATTAKERRRRPREMAATDPAPAPVAPAPAKGDPAAPFGSSGEGRLCRQDMPGAWSATAPVGTKGGGPHTRAPCVGVQGHEGRGVWRCPRRVGRAWVAADGWTGGVMLGEERGG